MTQQEREARVREIQKEMADKIIQAVAKMRSPKTTANDICTAYIVTMIAEIRQKLEENGIK